MIRGEVVGGAGVFSGSVWGFGYGGLGDVTIGGSLYLGPVRLDLGYAHVFFADRNVTNSRSLQLNPIQPALAVAVGNGRYTASADVLTAGLEARF